MYHIITGTTHIMVYRYITWPCLLPIFYARGPEQSWFCHPVKFIVFSVLGYSLRQFVWLPSWVSGPSAFWSTLPLSELCIALEKGPLQAGTNGGRLTPYLVSSVVHVYSSALALLGLRPHVFVFVTPRTCPHDHGSSRAPQAWDML